MKKIAILQSNYIPWKGYFDLIAAVDEFILYDDMQFTKNDWRNRNKIKTPRGVEWLTIPAGQDTRRRIRDVSLPDSAWQAKHWRSIEMNYRRAPHFAEIQEWLESLYLDGQHADLSSLNRKFIEAICDFLQIRTVISNSWDYDVHGARTARLANLCAQAGGTEYISGPAAKAYLEERVLLESGISVTWFNYTGYPEYPQLWGQFIHEVTVLDLLFNCGKDAPRYMRYART